MHYHLITVLIISPLQSHYCHNHIVCCWCCYCCCCCRRRCHCRRHHWNSLQPSSFLLTEKNKDFSYIVLVA